MGEVKVLGAFGSPFGYRVEWALLHKGIKYEYIDEDLKNKSPLLLKCNPVHKKIPVLLHGEKPIAESLIILEYIDEMWKENPFLPRDPLERAKARFWAKFAEDKVLGAFISCFAHKVEWALLHKGIKYEYIEEDLQNKSPLLLKCNPVHKKVPVILHGERTIAESYIILEYIHETWKENALLPEDPFERAKCLCSARTACVSEGKEQEKAVEESLEALKILEEELRGKKFFGGESVGFMDLVVGWIPHWMPVFEEVGGFKLLDADAFPSLHAWGDRFLNVPFIKEKLPPSDRLRAIFTGIRKGWPKK